ncbi:MAG: branched-chain amino acid ABC transporter permease [Candidatus Caldarchaeum sp.]
MNRPNEQIMKRSVFTNLGIKDYLIMGVVVLYLTAPFLTQGGYSLRVFTLITFFTSFSISFNILFGRSNQLYLCLAALAGISAYTSGILSRSYGVDPWIGIIIGSLFSMVISGALSYVSHVRRLGVVYIAVLTLAFELMFENVVVALADITGGDIGFRLLPLRLGFLGEVMGQAIAIYYVSAILASVLLMSSYFVFERGKAGIILEAIRQDETAAAILGINCRRIKVYTSLACGFTLGLSGALYAYFNGFVSPFYYSFPSIDVLTQVMTIFGGRGTILGPVVGSYIFTYVNENIRFFGPQSLIMYGLTYVVLFTLFRRGLIPSMRRWVKWLF